MTGGDRKDPGKHMNKENGLRMSRHYIQKIGTAILAATMAAGMIPAQVFAAEDNNPTEKTETVYTVLNPDGSVNSTVVSAWLHDDDGLHNVKEDLKLKNVENVKGDDKPSVSGETYTWNSSEKDIWYKGDATKELPVSVLIDYTLDGKDIKAEDLAGKSGKLGIRIRFTNNVGKQVQLNGKTVTVHPSFLAGGMMDMDAENCKNVKCAQGKIVSDGTNEFLAFAAVPGLEETMQQAGLSDMAKELDISDEIEITADVKEYDPSGLMMAMTNDLDLEEIPQLGSVSELTGGVKQLYDASLQLEDGSKQLYDGTSQLKAGIQPLTSALPQISQLGDAATQLHNGTSTLKAGLLAYTAGEEQLAAGTKQLYGITDGIGQVQSSVSSTDGSVMTLKKGSESLAAGLKQLQGSVDQLDAAGVNQLLADAKTQLEGMQQTVAKDRQVLTGLQTSMSSASASMTQLQQAMPQFEAAVQDAAGQMQTIAGTIAADNQMIADSQTQLTAAKTSVTNQIDASIQALTDAKAAVAQSAAATDASSQQAASETNASIQQAVAAANAELPADKQITVNAAATAATAQVDTTQIDAQIAALQQAKADVAAVQDLNSLKALDGTQLMADLQGIQKTLEKVGQTLTPMAGQLTDAGKALDGLDADLTASIQTLDGMQQQMQGMKLPENIDALKAGVAQLSAGADSLNTGVAALETGLAQLQTQSKAALDQVNAGADQLTGNNAALVAGATQLDDGTAQLEGQKGRLSELGSGMSQLTSAVDQLNSGARQLYDGNQEFVSSGTKKLNDSVNVAAGDLEVFKKLAGDVRDLNAEYEVFAGAPKDAETRTMYVFRTQEIQSDKKADDGNQPAGSKDKTADKEADK